jgi:hypothetical protein
MAETSIVDNRRLSQTRRPAILAAGSVGAMSRYIIIRNVHGLAMTTLLALMLFHAALAPVMFQELSGQLVWYVATDLAVLYLVFLNVTVIRMSTPNRLPWTLCHAANALGVALGVFNLISVDDPINIVVLAAYAALAVGAWGRDGGSDNMLATWVRGGRGH